MTDKTITIKHFPKQARLPAILLLRFFPWLFLAGGIVLLSLGIFNYVRGRESVNWPTIQGIITHASVERHRDSEGHSSYSANIKYRFQIEETTFQGDRISFGDYGSSDSSHADNIVAKYPRGKKATISYMPSDPEVCVLELGLKGLYWLFLLMGLVFFTIGILSVLFLSKQLNQMASQISKLNNDEKQGSTTNSDPH